MRFGFLALAAAFALLGAAPAVSPPPAPVRVPLLVESDHLYVTVTIGGNPLHFVVDSGGGELLDDAVARRLNLAEQGRLTITGVGNGKVRAWRTTVDQVGIGDATLRNVHFVVLPIDTTFGIAEGVHIDGMIGPALLDHFIVTFDPAGGTLTLAPPGSGEPGDVPLTLDRADHPSVPCTVAQIATRCMLDTGSRLAISLPRPFLEAHPEIMTRALTAEGVDGYGIGGAARGQLGRVTVALGGRTQLVVGDFTAQRAGAFAFENYGGNVGQRMLRRFVLTLDYGRKRAHFAPSSLADAVDRVDRSGLFLIRSEDRTMAIDARPGTPAAAAGVRDGDELIAIDGTPAASLALDDIRARLSAAAGTRIALQLRNEGVDRTVNFALADYVPSATLATALTAAGSRGNAGSM